MASFPIMDKVIKTVEFDWSIKMVMISDVPMGEEQRSFLISKK